MSFICPCRSNLVPNVGALCNHFGSSEKERHRLVTELGGVYLELHYYKNMNVSKVVLVMVFAEEKEYCLRRHQHLVN